MAQFVATLALLAAASLPLAAQSRILVATSEIPIQISDDYPGGSAYPTFCDEQGRAYLKLITRAPGMVGPLFRLSRNGIVEAEFDTTGAMVNRYAVRPDGGVIMMYFGGSGKVIDSFAPDGTRVSSVDLQNPPVPFFPSQMAVFRSGEILVAGQQTRINYKASTAIYDPAGLLVKQIALDGDEQIERSLANANSEEIHEYIGAVSASVAIAGDDGLVYLMRATSPAIVYAISPAGDVVRKIVVKAPGGVGSPQFAVRVAKNRLVVQFGRSCDSNTDADPCRTSTYAVVDATTGKELATYEADQEVSGPLLCYAPDPDRFLILQQHSAKVFDILQAEPADAQMGRPPR